MSYTANPTKYNASTHTTESKKKHVLLGFFSAYSLFTIVWIFLYMLFYENEIVRIVMLYGYLVIFLFYKPEDSITSLYILLPFLIQLKFADNTFSAVLICECIIIAKWLLSRSERSILFLIPLVGLIALQLISSLVYSSSFVFILPLLINLVLMYALMDHFSESEGDMYTKVTIAYITGFVLSNIFYLNNIFNEAGYYVRFTGQWSDPNYYSQQINIAIAFTLSLFAIKKINVYLGIAVLIFLMYCGVNTYSRTFALTLVFMLGVFILYSAKNSSKNYSNASKASMIILGIVVITATYFYVIVPISETRGLLSENIDISAGRLTFTENILSFMCTPQGASSWIWGLGASQNYLVVGRALNIVTGGSHNTLVDYFSELGILGVVFVIIFLKDQLKKLRYRIGNVHALFVWVIAISSLTLGLMSTDYLYALLAVLATVPQIEPKKSERDLYIERIRQRRLLNEQ